MSSARRNDARWSDADPTHRHLLARRDAAVVRMLSDAGLWPLAGRTVVDLGCGRGHSLVRFASEPDARLVGVDRSIERLAEARERLPTAALVRGDLRAPPLRVGSADLVLLFTVLSSEPDPEVRAELARHALETLRPGGAILIYDLRVAPPSGRSSVGTPLVAIPLRELRRLFPAHELNSRTVTLSPPLARVLCPHLPILADLLELLPCLRTHRLSLIRPRPPRGASSSRRPT